jgi:putative ABC transport system permease protein
MTSTLERPQPTDARTLQPSRLRLRDITAVATVGPRTRRLRTVLTAVGIAIGIAALVAVMGISESSKANLLARLDALGTNRLQVQPGQSLVGDDVTLPDTASNRIRRLDAIDQAAAVSSIDATVRRSDVIPETNTSGIGLRAADLTLPATVGATVAQGRWHDAASERLPTVVLGAVAAQRLGIGNVDGRAVLIGDQWFTVIGILEPIPLYNTLDSAALIGYPIAEELFDADPSPSTVYVTTDPDLVNQTRDVLAATTNPEAPSEVDVTNPSDALAAKEAVDDTLTALLLGLGGVALLVGGIGIANVMVIGVLERRTEIGVRRALGATKRHIRIQFLLEAILLGTLGGLIGVGLGLAVTAAYTNVRHLTLAIPPDALWIGLGSAIAIGGIAGVSPAARAARLAPAEAIRPA